MKTLREATTALWEDILRLQLPGVALILDHHTAQCLKWSIPGGFASLWEYGVGCIRDIGDCHQDDDASTTRNTKRLKGLKYALAFP